MDWTNWTPTLQATLMFIVDEAKREVLLIRKKRGLGEGKINGPGGKMDPGETPEQCAVRETQEELGVTALNPVKHGELWFDFTDGLKMRVHVFLAAGHEGVAHETAEAVPLWTSLGALPFEEMWEDDRYWLKELLIDRLFFTGRFQFDGEKMTGGEMEWNEENWG